MAAVLRLSMVFICAYLAHNRLLGRLLKSSTDVLSRYALLGIVECIGGAQTPMLFVAAWLQRTVLSWNVFWYSLFEYND